GSALLPGRVVLPQRGAAVVAKPPVGGVVGAAVGADALPQILRRGFRRLVRHPLKAGAVLVGVDAGPDLLPAGPVIGRAAVGADDHVVVVGEYLIADRAMISCI